jgi:hypothetical protein
MPLPPPEPFGRVEHPAHDRRPRTAKLDRDADDHHLEEEFEEPAK